MTTLSGLFNETRQPHSDTDLAIRQPVSQNITVLTAIGRRLQAKRWLPDGTTTPADTPKNFKHRVAAVSDIQSLSAVLHGLTPDKQACVVRGTYIGDELAVPLMRALPVVEGETPWQEGCVLKRGDYFTDAPQHPVMLDVDGFKPTAGDPRVDTEACIDEFITSHLSPCFHGVSHHWQLSGSAGLAKNAGVLKVHLWFWLTTPYTSAELKAWAESAPGMGIDTAVFGATQPLYTAAPIMLPGVADPVPVRSGFTAGLFSDAVDLVIDADLLVGANVPRATSATPGGGEAPDDIKKVARALWAIHNDLERGEWFKVKCATHEATGGSLEGFELFKAWTSTYPGDDGSFNLAKWNEKDKGGVTRATLYALASKCNPQWNEMPMVEQIAGLEDVPDVTPAGGTLSLSNGGELTDADLDALDSTLELVDPDLIDMTDSGNVNLLAKQTNGNLRHVSERGVAIWWNGRRWVEDTSKEIYTQQALRVASHYMRKAATEARLKADPANSSEKTKGHEKNEAAFKSWSNKSRCRTGIDSMLALAWRDPRFAISQSALDTDINLLGVQNGVVDLRTGELRAAGRDDFVTQRCAAKFNPAALAPLWLRTLDEVTSVPVADGRSVGPIAYRMRPDLVNYLHMFMGYALTGHTREHKAVFGTGGGSNGKSLIFDTVQAIMSNYCGTVPADVLMAHKVEAGPENASPIARTLAGKRLILATEGKEGQKLNTAIVKRMTGDAQMTARGLHEKPFTFNVTHKILLLTNHQPDVDSMDEAMAGRIHSVPFDRTWNRPGVTRRDPRLADGDKDLKAKLAAESEGILAWMVRGSVTYMTAGLQPPQAVSEKTNSYLADQDSLGLWLDEMEVCVPAVGMTAGTLLEDYRMWCDVSGLTNTQHSHISFAKGLKNRNVEFQRRGAGVAYGLKRPENLGLENHDLF